MQIALSQVRAISPSMAARWFRNWWLKEFLNLLPERAVEWFADQGRAKLLLAPNEGSVLFSLRNSRDALVSSQSIGGNAVSPGAIDQFLRAHQVDPKDADVGLLLPRDRIFSRQLRLPAEAIGAVDAIVNQDLTKKTPFKQHDIFSDYVATPDSRNSRILIHQWIVQRQYVEEALSELKIDPGKLAFVASDAVRPDEPAPFINLNRKENAPNVWLRKITLALSCSVILLSIVAGGLKYWTQHREMDRLGAEIAIKNKKAQQVRSLIDQLQSRKSALLRLRLQRGEMPGVLDLWEEVTRILPAHTWLTELRLTETGSKREEQITISGFSGAAPSLVGIIDNSPLFFDAALTSPIAFDPGEGRERFSLQAKVRIPELKEVGR
jgi:general secretion pathway protein L